MEKAQLKQHAAAFRQWNEFVSVSRQNGMADQQIRERLAKANVNPVAIDAMLDPRFHWQVKSLTAPTGKWKIAMGVFKLVLGAFGFLVFATTGTHLFTSIIAVVAGLAWLASYASDKNKMSLHETGNN